MIPWLSGKVTSWRSRGLGWRALAAIAVVVLIAIGALVMWWRRRAQAARLHEAFVAQVRAREAETTARETTDAASVVAFKEAAAAAGRRAELAQDRAVEASRAHARDRDAIDRVRTWDDVAPRPGG